MGIMKMMKIKVKSCHNDGMSYMFTLTGDWMPATVMEMRTQNDVLMAIVNVEPWDTEGTLIAHTIWLDREKFYGKPVELFVDPYVRVAPLNIRSLERYMEAEGKQSITHVLHTTSYTYIVNRMTYDERKSHNPWICYLLDHNSAEYSDIHEAASLADMQEWLGEQEPQKKREIREWHIDGKQIFNLLNYGVYADGTSNDTAKVLSVINMMNRGDILYLPTDRRIRLSSSIMLPKGIVIDIRDDQMVTEGIPL